MTERNEEERRPVCVIGASGFVGSHVAAALLERGYTVHGTTRPESLPGKRAWLTERLGARATGGARLELFGAHVRDEAALRAALAGCGGVFMCAGSERRDPSTIELMVGAARATLSAARAEGVGAAVLTSSTGSTNPPGPEPRPKREGEHVSDPMQQLAAGKYSPAAKTLMEAVALRVAEESEGALRVAIMNPSLILGPAYQPELPASLAFLARIITGERMAEAIPPGSMSVVDARDLAALHVAAYEDPAASGRYFAVKRSWPWREILHTLAAVHPDYTPPDTPAPADPPAPTEFDLGRQASLGVTLRGLEDILRGAVDELVGRGAV
jgi:nucleoside-diphosphate-sugar epimerase